MSVTGQQLVDYAKQSLGVKYVWGGNSLTSGIDCSGLIQQVYAKYGISLPRVTYNQINSGASVSRDTLRVGDLVFFDTEKDTAGADHVGMYIGGGKFIHAPHTGDVVKISSLADSYYANRFMGGRRIAGVQDSGTVGTTEDPVSVQNATRAQATAAVTPKLDSTELAQRYGLSFAFFQTDPELKGLLGTAVEKQWSTDQYTAALKNTTWWKTNSETMRQAKQQEATDPATFKASLSAAADSLKQQALAMGAVVSDAQLQTAARNVVALGWQDAQIKDFLGQYIDFTDKQVLGGQAGATAAQIRTVAYNNGVSLDDQTVKNYAAYVGRGISTLQGTLDYVRQQAAGAYPAFREQILAGQNVSDIAAPYAQTMGKELELPQAQLNPFDPKIKAALNRMDAQGKPAPMTLGDFQQSIRQDPRWRQTTGALNSTMSVAKQVLGSMGLTGGM